MKIIVEKHTGAPLRSQVYDKNWHKVWRASKRLLLSISSHCHKILLEESFQNASVHKYPLISNVPKDIAAEPGVEYYVHTILLSNSCRSIAFQFMKSVVSVDRKRLMSAWPVLEALITRLPPLKSPSALSIWFRL